MCYDNQPFLKGLAMQLLQCQNAMLASELVIPKKNYTFLTFEFGQNIISNAHSYIAFFTKKTRRESSPKWCLTLALCRGFLQDFSHTTKTSGLSRGRQSNRNTIQSWRKYKLYAAFIVLSTQWQLIKYCRMRCHCVTQHCEVFLLFCPALHTDKIKECRR